MATNAYNHFIIFDIWKKSVEKTKEKSTVIAFFVLTNDTADVFFSRNFSIKYNCNTFELVKLITKNWISLFLLWLVQFSLRILDICELIYRVEHGEWICLNWTSLLYNDDISIWRLATLLLTFSACECVRWQNQVRAAHCDMHRQMLVCESECARRHVE